MLSVLERTGLLLDGLIWKSGVVKQSHVVPLNESLITIIAVLSPIALCVHSYLLFDPLPHCYFLTQFLMGRKAMGLLSAQWTLVSP